MSTSVLLLVVGLLVACNATIISYKNHLIFPTRPEFLTFAKYAKADAPAWTPGHGKSYIDLSRLNVRMDCSVPNNILAENNAKLNCKTTIMDILLIQADLKNPWADAWEDHQYCCNKDQVDAGL